jgi:sortase A
LTLKRDTLQFHARTHAGTIRLILVVALLSAVAVLAACSASPSGPPPEPTAAPPAVLPAPGDGLPTSPAALAKTPAAATPAAGEAQASGTPAAGEPPTQGEPNRLVIPSIDLDTAIVDVGWEVVERGAQRTTEWQTADNAAGRHINSAQPGEPGNVVLSGHHNTKGEVFRRISEQELAPGDMVYLYDDQGRRLDYQVTEVTEPLLEVGASEAQRLANAGYIQPSSDARVTLVTCWPYWTNTHRIVVVAELVQ